MEYQEYRIPLEDLQQTKRDLVSLLEHRGWKHLKGLLDQQSRLRRIDAFQHRIMGLDDAFKIAQTQGEVAGLQSLGALVDVLINDLTAEIEQRLMEDREAYNGTERDTD